MPLLQVRNIPQDVYDSLSRLAQQDNRSIAQETIVLLRKALHLDQERSIRRKNILEEIKNLQISGTEDFPDPADLIRQDRER